MKAVKSHSVLFAIAVCLCLAAGVVAQDGPVTTPPTTKAHVVLPDQDLKGDGIPVIIKSEPPKFTVGLRNGHWSLLECEGADLVDILTEIAHLEATQSPQPASLLIEIPKGTTITGAFLGERAGGAATPIKLAEALVKHLKTLKKPVEWKSSGEGESQAFSVAAEKKAPTATRAAEIPVYNLDNVKDLAALVPATAVPQTQIKVEGRRLLVQGTDSQIENVRRFVALIDTPRPQVRLQVWTLQFNGKAVKRGGDESVQRKLEEALSKIETTRGNMALMRDHALAEVFEQLRRAWMPVGGPRVPPGGWTSATPVGMSNAMAAAMIGATPGATFGPTFSAIAGTRPGYPPEQVLGLVPMDEAAQEHGKAAGAPPETGPRRPAEDAPKTPLELRIKLLPIRALLVRGHIYIRQAWRDARSGYQELESEPPLGPVPDFPTEYDLKTLHDLLIAPATAAAEGDITKAETEFRRLLCPQGIARTHAAELEAALKGLCEAYARVEQAVDGLNSLIGLYDFEAELRDAQYVRGLIRKHTTKVSEWPRPHSVAHANALRDRREDRGNTLQRLMDDCEVRVSNILRWQAQRSAAGRHVLEAEIKFIQTEIRILSVVAALSKLAGGLPAYGVELTRLADELDEAARKLPENSTQRAALEQQARELRWDMAAMRSLPGAIRAVASSLLVGMEEEDRRNVARNLNEVADGVNALLVPGGALPEFAEGLGRLATQLEELAGRLPEGSPQRLRITELLVEFGRLADVGEVAGAATAIRNLATTLSGAADEEKKVAEGVDAVADGLGGLLEEGQTLLDLKDELEGFADDLDQLAVKLTPGSPQQRTLQAQADQLWQLADTQGVSTLAGAIRDVALPPVQQEGAGGPVADDLEQVARGLEGLLEERGALPGLPEKLGELAAQLEALAQRLPQDPGAQRDLQRRVTELRKLADTSEVPTLVAAMRPVAAALSQASDGGKKLAGELGTLADALQTLAEAAGLTEVVSEVRGALAGEEGMAAVVELLDTRPADIPARIRGSDTQRIDLAVLAEWPLDTPVGAVSLLLWAEPETARDCFQRAADRMARVYDAAVGTEPHDDGTKPDGEATVFPLFQDFLQAQVTRAHWGQPFREFLQAAAESQTSFGKYNVTVYARSQAACDEVLREGMQALCLDIESMFMAPLLDGLTEMSGNGKDATKVALLGRSTIIAQSGSKATMTAEASSYYDTTRTTPFTKDLLASAKTISESLTGIGTAAGAMSTADLLLIAAALDEQAPTYTKLAPGVTLEATPVVLEDLNSIRLHLDFGVSMGRTLPPTGSSAQPAPIVEKHSVVTDPSSVVFDLLAVSMFDVQTSHPTRGWHIPVLHRVPLVGQIFEGPRRSRTMDQTSLILLTHAIEPRAIDFARGRYYKGVQEAPAE